MGWDRDFSAVDFGDEGGRGLGWGGEDGVRGGGEVWAAFGVYLHCGVVVVLY